MPMVIHTKERIKIHIHKQKRLTVNDSNFRTAECSKRKKNVNIGDTGKKKYCRNTVYFDKEGKKEGLLWRRKKELGISCESKR